MKFIKHWILILLVGTFWGSGITSALAVESWVVDSASGAKIGWVSGNGKLRAASWSGPVFKGKATGKGTLVVTIRDKDEKDLQGTGKVEMSSGLLDGKAVIKWSDGFSYDGYYKAGLRDGKGIMKWPSGQIYEGEWKDDMYEGTGTYTWPDGTVFEGIFKKALRNGHGVLKDVSGKVLYDGEWKDDKKSDVRLKTDKVLGIPWGASENEAKRIMLQRPNTYYQNIGVKNALWFGGDYNGEDAHILIYFNQGKMYYVCIQLLGATEDNVMDRFNSVKQGLSQRYGSPLSEKGKYLDSVIVWDLGEMHSVGIGIEAHEDINKERFRIKIWYWDTAAQKEITDKASGPTLGKDY